VCVTPSVEPITPKGRRTREALLDAGERIADRDGLSGLTIASVVASAGVAKGTFYVYFPDREKFIDALHLRFYDRVSNAVTNAVAGLEPGPELLLASAYAYLDVCLANRAVKALVFETRAQASLTTTMYQRQQMFAELAEPSIRAIGLTPSKVVARLFVSLTQEAAMIELEAGRRVPGARAVLRRLVT
jgi:TetR/AcrR family transcriptional regulator, transcriptional repressor for nem operon